MKATKAQIKMLHALLSKLGLDAGLKREIILNATDGRTEHSSELTAQEMAVLLNKLQQQAIGHEAYRRQRVLNKTRWRLIYTLRDKGMALPDGTPDYNRIHSYIQHYWGKHINHMSLPELNKYIGVVKRWEKLKYAQN